MRERTEIGGYSLIKRIGSGGMSAVFEAEDAEGHRVALKLLHPAFVDSRVGRERLRREIQMMQRVKGPYVAEVVDAEADEDEAFIVTELIDGPTLEQDVQDSGVFTGEDLLELAKQLNEAVKSVHAVGVLHRDIKPSNVMMSRRGPILIDFGIAQVEEDQRLTLTGQLSHTPGYCDPRIFEGSSPDEASDIWAMVAVLAYAATGSHPFGSGTSPTVLRRVLAGDADVFVLDPPLAAAFRSALSPQLEQRISFDELLNVIENPSAGEYLLPSSSTLPMHNLGAGADVGEGGGVSAPTLVPHYHDEEESYNFPSDGSGTTRQEPQRYSSSYATLDGEIEDIYGESPQRAKLPDVSTLYDASSATVVNVRTDSPSYRNVDSGVLHDPRQAPELPTQRGDMPYEDLRDAPQALRAQPLPGIYQTAASAQSELDSPRRPFLPTFNRRRMSGNGALGISTSTPGHSPIEDWMVPPPPSRLSVLLAGLCLGVSGYLIPGWTLAFYYVLLVVFSTLGLLSSNLRARRLAHGGCFRGDRAGSLVRTPLFLIQSLVVQLINVAMSVAISYFAMNFLYAQLGLKKVLLLGVTLVLLISWLIGPNHAGREGVRVALKYFSPSEGYKHFWWSALLVAFIIGLSYVALGYQAQWDPLPEPYFFDPDYLWY